MRFLVIINPASSRGDTQRAEAAIPATLSLPGSWRSEVVHTERRGPCSADRHRSRVAEFEGRVAVGGDGTLHEILQAIDIERHVIGLVPRGSGNDFAWMNGWPADIEKCAARIAAQQERRIDLGLWDGGRFHTSVGAGFEARVDHESHRVKYLRGPAIYLAALARVLNDLHTYPARVDWSGGSWEGDMLLASIGNGARVGGAFMMTPDARNDDGMLDMCLAPKIKPGAVAAPAAAHFQGEPRAHRAGHAAARPAHPHRPAPRGCRCTSMARWSDWTSRASTCGSPPRRCGPSAPRRSYTCRTRPARPRSLADCELLLPAALPFPAEVHAAFFPTHLQYVQEGAVLGAGQGGAQPGRVRRQCRRDVRRQAARERDRVFLPRRGQFGAQGGEHGLFIGDCGWSASPAPSAGWLAGRSKTVCISNF